MTENLHERGLDPARSRLRATIATMEKELSSLRASSAKGGGGGAYDALIASFDDLVRQLALGPEPEVRECPKCGGIGMRFATLCGSCWTKLTPPKA
jgi:hypothetical protein